MQWSRAAPKSGKLLPTSFQTLSSHVNLFVFPFLEWPKTILVIPLKSPKLTVSVGTWKSVHTSDWIKTKIVLVLRGLLTDHADSVWPVLFTLTLVLSGRYLLLWRTGQHSCKQASNPHTVVGGRLCAIRSGMLPHTLSPFALSWDSCIQSSHGGLMNSSGNHLSDGLFSSLSQLKSEGEPTSLTPQNIQPKQLQ